MIKRLAQATIFVLCAYAMSESFAAQVAAKVDFAHDIQPLFKQYCIGCHGPTQQMNGYRLDQRRFSMMHGLFANSPISIASSKASRAGGDA
jgi:hypothetical protein